MKRVLIDYQGDICHIVVPNGDLREEAVYVSKEFEVYTGPDCSSKWIDAPDDVDQFWRLEKGEWVDRSQSWTDPIRARMVAYGPFGEQLDMIYKDMVNGTNKWQEHVAKVKTEIPMDADIVNNNSKEPILHGRDRPAWTFLPDWDDQVTV